MSLVIEAGVSAPRGISLTTGAGFFEERRLPNIREKIARALVKSSFRITGNLTQRQAEVILKEREERVLAAERDLEQISQGLDPDERVIFPSAYRFFRGTPSEIDYNLFDALGQGAERKVREIAERLKREGATLTPDILWREIPEMDPHRKTRNQQGELIEGVHFRPSASSHLEQAALPAIFLTKFSLTFPTPSFIISSL